MSVRIAKVPSRLSALSSVYFAYSSKLPVAAVFVRLRNMIPFIGDLKVYQILNSRVTHSADLIVFFVTYFARTGLIMRSILSYQHIKPARKAGS